jgi:arylsulfatase A-like enzyme
VSTTSWTLPAHAALLTGLYDSTHGLVDNGLRLADEQVTLAEALRGAGYQTAGFYGGPYLHPTFGLGQGFDHYQSCMTKLADNLTGAAARAASNAEVGAAHDDVTGPRTVAEVTRWLRTADDRPFFLFVHLWDVHYDYLAPDRYVRMFDPDYRGTLDGRHLMQNPAINAGMPARDLHHLIALYDAEIRFTDETLGRLLSLLEKRGRLGNTLVVITADHGEEFFEHGGKGHQRTLFDEVVRVPLVFSWPGRLGPGRVVPDQVRLIDVMPTLLAMAGVTHSPQMQGRDLSPLLRGGHLPPVAAMSELLVDGRSMRSLRRPDFKFIEQGPGLDSGGFDLLADPAERHPISPRNPVVSAGLLDLTRALDEALGLREKLARAPRAADPDDETLRRLRGLGYVGGSGGADDDSPH